MNFKLKEKIIIILILISGIFLACAQNFDDSGTQNKNAITKCDSTGGYYFMGKKLKKTNDSIYTMLFVITNDCFKDDEVTNNSKELYRKGKCYWESVQQGLINAILEIDCLTLVEFNIEIIRTKYAYFPDSTHCTLNFLDKIPDKQSDFDDLAKRIKEHKKKNKN